MGDIIVIESHTIFAQNVMKGIIIVMIRKNVFKTLRKEKMVMLNIVKCMKLIMKIILLVLNARRMIILLLRMENIAIYLRIQV